MIVLTTSVEWKNINSNVLSYMDRMNISELDFIDIERPSLFRRRNYQKSDVLVELSVIKDIQQASSAIRKTKDILDCWLPSSHKTCKFNLATLIKETVENSIEHSSVDLSNGSCYYLLQKYGYSDGSTQVQIAVGDAGVGMLTSQRRVYPATKDDAEALINAVMYGKSGRKTGGGMGYVTIREVLRTFEGEDTGSIRKGTYCTCCGTILTQVFIGILAFLLAHKLFLNVMLDKAK